jgi:hypothetical protein
MDKEDTCSRHCCEKTFRHNQSMLIVFGDRIANLDSWKFGK